MSVKNLKIDLIQFCLWIQEYPWLEETRTTSVRIKMKNATDEICVVARKKTQTSRDQFKKSQTSRSHWSLESGIFSNRRMTSFTIWQIRYSIVLELNGKYQTAGAWKNLALARSNFTTPLLSDISHTALEL